MHSEQYSQQKKILKLPRYSLTHTHTYKYNTQTKAYCYAICQEMLSKTRTFVVVVAQTVITSTTIRPQSFLPQTYLHDTTE